MAKERVTTAGLDRAAVENSTRLITEMRRLGTRTSRDELIRALVWGVTAPQAIGMLSAYIMYAEARDESEHD